jgi:hypothetical protein
MSILNKVGEILIKFILFFNNFFNHNIRDSESDFITVVWTTSVAIGWVKFVFELKNIVDFFVRHLLWGYLYPLFWKTHSETKDLLKIYGNTQSVKRR